MFAELVKDINISTSAKKKLRFTTIETKIICSIRPVLSNLIKN